MSFEGLGGWTRSLLVAPSAGLPRVAPAGLAPWLPPKRHKQRRRTTPRGWQVSLPQASRLRQHRRGPAGPARGHAS